MPSLPAGLPRLAAKIRRCTWCDLSSSRAHAVPGEGPAHARLFLIGEAPGRREDAEGRPFVGLAGRVLDEALARAAIRRPTIFVTNTVKCRPPGNRRPKAKELSACRPYLMAQLATVRPGAIVTLGQSAAKDVLGPSTSLANVRGRWSAFGGTPVLPTYHPAAVLYNRELFRILVADLRKARRRVEAA